MVLACEFTSVSGNMTIDSDTASSSSTVGLDTGVGVWGDAQLGSRAKKPTIHEPVVNFLALDGHVLSLRPEQVSSGVNAASSTESARATPLAAAGTAALGKLVLTFSIR
jgi:hypothetical protein